MARAAVLRHVGDGKTRPRLRSNVARLRCFCHDLRISDSLTCPLTVIVRRSVGQIATLLIVVLHNPRLDAFILRDEVLYRFRVSVLIVM
jgi:hypothetical protein